MAPPHTPLHVLVPAPGVLGSHRAAQAPTLPYKLRTEFWPQVLF